MKKRTNNKFLKAALSYRRKLNWSIVPCNGKTASIPWSKYEKELPTEQEIDSWWSQFPNANLAVVVGKHSGIIGLDVDDLQYFRGKGFEMPLTPKALSGGGGEHFILNYPDEGDKHIQNYKDGITQDGKFKERFSIRCKKQYLILPDSIHPETGKPYEWIESRDPFSIPIADPPKWILDLVLKNPKEEIVNKYTYDNHRDSFKEFIKELKSKIKLSNLLLGLGYKGKGHERYFSFFCPFHDDGKSPDFAVWDDICGAHDYHDDEGYDGINLLMKLKGWDFMDTVKFLASRAGMEIPKEEKEPKKWDNPHKSEKSKTLTTTFLQLNERLIELIRDGHDTAYISYNTQTGEIGKPTAIKVGNAVLVPPEPNLIKKKIILLPSGVREYSNESSLLHTIKGFINRYVELGDFLYIASLYVLFSWLYDRFTELPYLRFMGDYGTGKSRALVVVGSICYKPFFTFGASTVSPIFRLLDAFRGTMILDEGDHRDSSMWNELVKILNTGFQANIPLLRTEGDRRKEVKAYHVFGPKLIATRRPFQDDALESRCLTKVMPPGARRSDIPINLPESFYKGADILRKYLLLFRFKNYLSTQGDQSAQISDIEDRLNQVLSLLLSIARGGFRIKLDQYCYSLQQRVFEVRSQSLEGITVKALWDLKGGNEVTIKQVSAQLPDVSPQKTGRVIRSLGLETRRSTKLKGSPYIVVMEANKLNSLAKRYGVIE